VLAKVVNYLLDKIQYGSVKVRHPRCVMTIIQSI
jgi:hypothetical protein